jgi:hypothetical protein
MSSNNLIPPPPQTPPLLFHQNGETNDRSSKRAAVGYKAYTNEYARTQNVNLAMNAQQRAHSKFNNDNPMGGKRSKRKTQKRKNTRRKTHRK